MNLIIGAFTMGLILSLLSLGMLISFRMIKFTDITVDGSITLGASLAAVLIMSGMSPWLASFIAFLGGAVAGMITGILHTRFKIQQILAGILMMTALYSINLRIMGRSNIPLLDTETISGSTENVLLQINGGATKLSVFGWPVPAGDLAVFISSLLICLLLCIGLTRFLQTHFGTALRATGNNPQMVRAQGINNNMMVVFSLALSNGLVALSGALLAQYQGFADVQMGIGMMVWGLASIIIGEALVGKSGIGITITGAILGTILFRLLIAIALRWGLNPNDLKLVTAVFVFLALVAPAMFKSLTKTFLEDNDMLKINQLSKTFYPHTVNEVKALQNVNLTIEEGCFTAIIGTNGSGKSTLLNAIAGTFIPDSGSILLDNHEITTWPEHKRASLIGRVFQNPFAGSAAEMSIAENIVMAMKRGQSRSLRQAVTQKVKNEIADRVRVLKMGLEDRIDNPIGTLSGGQRQALTLLMATWLKPRLLLLDEHTAALDPKSAAKVAELTKQIVEKEKLTALMVTHSMQQAVDLPHRIVMMHRGQIVEDYRDEMKKRVRVHDLIDIFDNLQKRDLFDESVADLLLEQYI